MENTVNIWAPVVQAGMGGAFVVMTLLLWWKLKTDRVDRGDTFKSLLEIQQRTNQTLSENTQAYREMSHLVSRLGEQLDSQCKEMRALADELARRPCIRTSKGVDGACGEA